MNRLVSGGGVAVAGMIPAAAAVAAAPEAVDPGSLVQVVLMLVLVLLLIGGMAWVLRRMGGLTSTGAGALRVLGGVPVGQRERVVLVQVGETQLLLGVAPGRVQTLHVLDKPLTMPAAVPASGDSFAERLASALKQGKRP